MSLADTERNRAAVHEAGHALVAASRGLGVEVIALYRIDGEGGMRLHEEPSALDRIWVLLGGPFAEKVVFSRLASAAVPPEHDELLLAHKLCWERGINNTIGIMDQVEAFLREHQVLLERVARRLLETNTVDGADLDQLLGTDTITTGRTNRPSRLSATTSAGRKLSLWRRLTLRSMHVNRLPAPRQ